jgi:hypothetical protein
MPVARKSGGRLLKRRVIIFDNSGLEPLVGFSRSVPAPRLKGFKRGFFNGLTKYSNILQNVGIFL